MCVTSHPSLFFSKVYSNANTDGANKILAFVAFSLPKSRRCVVHNSASRIAFPNAKKYPDAI
jgi:hypothetical protein